MGSRKTVGMGLQSMLGVDELFKDTNTKTETSIINDNETNNDSITNNNNNSNNKNNNITDNNYNTNPSTIIPKKRVKYIESRIQRAYYFDKESIKIFDKHCSKNDFDKSDIMNQLLRKYLSENSLT